MKRNFLSAVFICFACSAVYANAGSPMMWLGMFHLVFINLIIGIAESEILNVYGIKNRKWLVIIANYVSMFIGLYFIAPHFSEMAGNKDFWGGNTRLGEYEMTGFYWGMISSFVATILIEFPFAFLAVKKKVKNSKLIKIFLIANLATNICMFLIYLLINLPGAATK